MIMASNSTVMGTKVISNSYNGMVIGNNITNYGSNVCILKNCHDQITYSNTSNNYTNINDILVSGRSSNNEVLTSLYGDQISIVGANASINVGKTIEFIGDTSKVIINDVINIDGLFSKLTLDQKIMLRGSNVLAIIPLSWIQYSSQRKQC